MRQRLPLATGLLAVLALAPVARSQDLVVRGETVYPVSGPAIEDGVVVVRDGVIAAVGPASQVEIPPGIELLEAAVVTPGLVDAHSTIGLSGVYGGRSGQVRDQDQLETSEPLQPDLRPEDAYNATDPLVGWIRRYGTTTAHTGHGPGAPISGQTMIVKTRGNTVEAAMVETGTALAVTLGPSVSSNFKSPGTRSKTVAMLRKAFLEAQAYAEARASAEALGDEDGKPGRDLKNEALAAALAGEKFVLVTAHTTSDIATALRLQREFGFRLLLDGAAEAYRLTDEILTADVPVLLHAPMLRAGGETRNAAIDSALRLSEAGVPFAIQTGFEGYVPKTRILLWEAAVAAGAGLGFDETLAAITLEPARILGIDDRVGSLEVGRDGDIVLFDGDPFEYTSHVCGVVIEGELLEDECS